MNDKKHQTLDNAKQMFYVYNVMGDASAIGFDYNHLINLPSIEGVTLKGDLMIEDFGIHLSTIEEILEVCKI